MSYEKSLTYSEDSKAYLAKVELRRQECLAKATLIMAEAAEDAARCIVKHTSTTSTEIIDAPTENVKLNASKHVLKLVGMEIERQEHSGTVSFQPLVLSRGAE